ncbi:phage tail protein [Citrobacter freundii]
MATKNHSILTNRGKALEAASAAGGTPVILKKFVVGDGNGQAVIPDAAQTALVREVYRGTISLLEVSPDQENQFIAYLVLPEGVGNFTVREVGLLTDNDELYALGSCAAIEKPVSGVTVTLQFRLAVSESTQITLQTSTGDGLFLRQDANLSDVRDKQQAVEHLGLKPTVDKAAGAVQRGGDTMTGKLTLPQTSAFGVNTDNALGGNSITLGDNDTGIKQNGDGVLDVYANGQHVFRFRSGEVQSLRSMNVSGRLNISGDTMASGDMNIFGAITSTERVTPSDYGNFDARYATQAWVLQNFVRSIRFGAVAVFSERHNNERMAGGVMTSWADWGGSNYQMALRPLQFLINQTWYTVAYT